MSSNFDLILKKLENPLAEPLSYEEEYALLEAVAGGDMLARQRIAESRLKQVISMVWDAGEISDHVLAGNAGLIKAIDAFAKNPGNWKSFDECVEKFIKQEIIE